MKTRTIITLTTLLTFAAFLPSCTAVIDPTPMTSQEATTTTTSSQSNPYTGTTTQKKTTTTTAY